MPNDEIKLREIAYVGVNDKGDEITFGFVSEVGESLNFVCSTAILDHVIDRLQLTQVDAHRRLGSPTTIENVHAPLLVHGTHIEWLVSKDRSHAVLEVQRERGPPIHIRCHPDALSDLAAQARNVLERFSSDEPH